MKLVVKTDYSKTTSEHEFFDDASIAFCKIRDAEGIGSREFHFAKLYDEDGKQFGHISYNGKVWAGTEKKWSFDTQVLFDPSEAR